jgi:pimeloyl-ACP methyl ester carboxylesterase
MECQIRDVSVYYEEEGTGRPLLMLHGWGLDHRHVHSEMEPVFEGRSGWRRIYLDLPGCGKTPAASWIAGQDQILEVVLGFIQRAVEKEQFAVAGVSAGALLARGVAYHLASRIDGLLLVVPVVVADDAKRDRPTGVTLVRDDALLAELEADKAEMLSGAVVQSRSYLDALCRDYLPALQVAEQGFLQPIREDATRYGFSFNVDELQQPFPAPTLILMGRQDAAVGYRDQWRLIENYPRGTFVVLDRAGHGLEVEQQVLFRALVGEWLDRVEEYAALRGASASPGGGDSDLPARL